ncbi:hypothetical protein [Acidicapsa ligni]|uniref:hypothetical protein n=1 Tax=Acidicapsa ligni TaxID=542300 RepID=UPI0021E0DAA3|nr:hypothetical protein [Acidicapsa ligni]
MNRSATLLCVIPVLLWTAGCGGSNGGQISTSPSSPQVYFAPSVGGNSQQILSVDDTNGIFTQTQYGTQIGPGPQVIDTGVLSIDQHGLRSLGILNNYAFSSTTGIYEPVTYPATSPEEGSFAVELPNQAGGFALLTGEPLMPLMNASQCPSLSTAQTYLYLTIPGALAPVDGEQEYGGWNPATDTAYGSVDISTSGGTVKFLNNVQYILPTAPGLAAVAPTQPGASTATGTCAPTLEGNLINAPGQLIITDPGGQPTYTPQAIMGIGPSGLLVENDSPTNPSPGTVSSLNYNNLLGAGTGAVGIPKPSCTAGQPNSSCAVDTSSLTGAKYLGFIYSAGYFSNNQIIGQATHVASFGYSSCPSVYPASSTVIYGGDFSNDDPSASMSGYGNCDFAVDLGPQDPTTDGLYPQATVSVGLSYAGNTTGKTYSFSAVAIAGQLNSTNAIFVIGVDSTEPWSIYLLQSK